MSEPHNQDGLFHNTRELHLGKTMLRGIKYHTGCMRHPDSRVNKALHILRTKTSKKSGWTKVYNWEDIKRRPVRIPWLNRLRCNKLMNTIVRVELRFRDRLTILQFLTARIMHRHCLVFQEMHQPFHAVPSPPNIHISAQRQSSSIGLRTTMPTRPDLVISDQPDTWQ